MGIDLAINTASAYMFDVSRKTTVSNTSKNDAFRESLGKQIAHQPYHKMDQATFLAYQDNVMKNGGSKELSYIHGITKSYCTGKPGVTTFEDAFPQYQVTTHIGNTYVSKANWQRNDFPFWNYFDKSASADCLNDWKPTGPNPSLSDANVQKGLSSIGAGQMAILIPDKLQEKMDADPEYAKQVMAKVQKWKEDYDNWDNAAGLSLGMDIERMQAVKSYCISLDEDGNVKQYTVTAPGRLTKSDDDYAVAREQERKKKREEEARLMQKISEKRRIEYRQMIEESYKKRVNVIQVSEEGAI